jgi:hypothetical protein
LVGRETFPSEPTRHACDHDQRGQGCAAPEGLDLDHGARRGRMMAGRRHGGTEPVMISCRSMSLHRRRCSRRASRKAYGASSTSRRSVPDQVVRPPSPAHVEQVDAGYELFEQLGGKLVARSDAARPHSDFARVGLGIGNKFGNRRGRKRWIDRAGPVGLTLAIDLAWRGIDVAVVEIRYPGEPPRPGSHPRSRACYEADIFRVASSEHAIRLI